MFITHTYFVALSFNTFSLNFGLFCLSSTEVFWIFAADAWVFASSILVLATVSNKVIRHSILGLSNFAFSALSSVLYQTLVLLCASFFIMLNTSEYIDWYEGFAAFESSYCASYFTQVVKLLITVTALFLTSFSNFLACSEVKTVEFPLLLLLLISFSFVLSSCTSFVLLLLALEGFSLILYILTTIEHAHGGVTAAVKYFAFGTLGSVLLFWGVVHLYAVTPDLSYGSLAHFLAGPGGDIVTVSLFMGLFLKLGAAPTHQWVADVYAGSQIQVTAIFGTLAKLVFFVLFARVAVFLPHTAIVDFTALASLAVGCFYALRQAEIKRFVAYSSIVHVSFLLMGDLSSSFIYLFTYVLSSLVLFSVLATVRVNGKELIYLSDLRYLRQSSYGGVVLITFALASAAGLPPFAGFYGKFSVWISLLEDVYLFNNTSTYLLLLVSVSLSLFTIFYYMRIMAYLFLGNDSLVSAEAASFQETGTAKSIFAASTRLYAFQAAGAFFLVFWTFFHASFLELAALIACSAASL